MAITKRRPMAERFARVTMIVDNPNGEQWVIRGFADIEHQSDTPDYATFEYGHELLYVPGPSVVTSTLHWRTDEEGVKYRTTRITKEERDARAAASGKLHR